MLSNSYSFPILIELEFSPQIFEKCLNTKLHGNPFNENRVVPCGRSDGRTDIHDKDSRNFSQFCELA